MYHWRTSGATGGSAPVTARAGEDGTGLILRSPKGCTAGHLSQENAPGIAAGGRGLESGPRLRPRRHGVARRQLGPIMKQVTCRACSRRQARSAVSRLSPMKLASKPELRSITLRSEPSSVEVSISAVFSSTFSAA